VGTTAIGLTFGAKAAVNRVDLGAVRIVVRKLGWVFVGAEEIKNGTTEVLTRSGEV
jgi:hypothetical protein